MLVATKAHGELKIEDHLSLILHFRPVIYLMYGMSETYRLVMPRRRYSWMAQSTDRLYEQSVKQMRAKPPLQQPSR